MAYAGILAHGTGLSAAECARMIPQLSATSIRLAMRWAGDERASGPGLPGGAGEFMQRQRHRDMGPSRSGLVGHDEPGDQPAGMAGAGIHGARRPPIGVYSHVARPLGIFHAQPIVLNERQGAAIEGVVRQERVEVSQLAVDTHGLSTDFAMALSRLLGFDLCPRLRELRQRHLFVPRGTDNPCGDRRRVRPAWTTRDRSPNPGTSWVHLAASVQTGHASRGDSAGQVRVGRQRRPDHIYAGVQLGKLLRTAFLTDYFVNAGFRGEPRLAPNRARRQRTRACDGPCRVSPGPAR